MNKLERVTKALKGMLLLFDDQGNIVCDFNQMQKAISDGYMALSHSQNKEENDETS